MTTPTPDAPEDVRRLLASSTLPDTIVRRVTEIVCAADLTAVQRVDLTRELIAHFEDGLGRGHEPEELLAAFGDDARVAREIHAAKRSSRVTVAERLGARGDSVLFVLLRDLRYAARRLAQSPGFTAVAILSLALGIGANTAIFSVVNTLLLRSLPAREPERLVNVYETSTDFPYNAFSWPDFIDFRERTGDIFASYSISSLTLAQLEGEGTVEALVSETVNGEYFTALGLEPAAGRLLGPQDNETRGGHPVVVLGYSEWQRRFHGDPEVIGRELRLSGTPFTIVGVAPKEWRGNLSALDPSLYLPVMMTDVLEPSARSKLDERGFHSFFLEARLQPGVSLEQAREAVEPVAQEMRETYPGDWALGNGFRLVPSQDVIIYPAFDGPITVGAWLLLAVVGMVLLLACANLAGFLLARAVDRRKEIAVRRALGATRAKLVGQLLTETVLLGVVGGGAGLLLAYGFLGWLRVAELPFPIPLSFDFTIDTSVLLFAGGVSILAGLVFGLFPALHATRADIVGTLRDESPGAGQGARTTLRNALVIGQMAVSVILLVVAGLLLRSVQAVYDLDPGFGRDPAAIVTFAVPVTSYDEARGLQLYEELERAYAALPGARAVGYTANLHLNPLNTQFYGITIDGVTPPAGQNELLIDYASADGGFFDAAGIDILRGRGFGPEDDAEGRPVAIVNETMARTYWPDGAVGATFRRRDTEVTVIGVSSDTKVRTLGEPPRPFIYRPPAQEYQEQMSFVVRTDGDPTALLPEMMSELHELAPDVIVFESKTMEDHLEVVRFPTRLSATVFGLFAALALGLAAIGLYGLMSYTQAQRTREVGIRLSLGADPGGVVRLLIRGGLKLALIGGAIGLLVAAALSRVASALLFGISPYDPATFLGVVAVLGTVAFLAAWIPARRASRVDPVIALRSE